MTAELLIPENDSQCPVVSLVIPSLNEEITIGLFIEWCRQGLEKANISGEILIVDSSTDRTSEIVVKKGARVLKVPRRGLGRAYIDAMPYIRGKYVILGDCDCTYDFREIDLFLKEFEKGAEFVMGSRFKGTIENGAMPPLHRFFGTPLTTWILNFLYGCRFSDIHCGMRGLTLDAFRKINLQSESWEYASEMIIKAVSLNLRTSEIPIHFLKDREGRVSHHKRMGWLSPWIAGWQSLRAFFIYRPSFFLRKPGLLSCVLGSVLAFGLISGPVTIGQITFSLHSQIFGLFLLALGLGLQQIDAMTCLLLEFDSARCDYLRKRFAYDRAAPLGFLLIATSFCLALPFVLQWHKLGYRSEGLSPKFIASLGIALIGFHLFIKSLSISVTAIKCKTLNK
jgi:hypothetical protein